MAQALRLLRPGFDPGQSVWNLSYTYWHWDRFLSYYLGFILLVSFHQWPILIFILLLFSDERAKPGELKKISSFVSNIGEHWTENLFVFDATFPHWTRASSFTRFLDHTQRRTTVGRTPLDEWLVRRMDIYLTTHNNHNRQIICLR